MRGGPRGLDGGEWALVALGWGAGLAWALVSIGVGIQWWDAATVSWWGEVLRAVLFWPLFAASHARIPGVDPLVLTFAIGGLTGIGGGLLLVWHLRR